MTVTNMVFAFLGLVVFGAIYARIRYGPRKVFGKYQVPVLVACAAVVVTGWLVVALTH